MLKFILVQLAKKLLANKTIIMHLDFINKNRNRIPGEFIPCTHEEILGLELKLNLNLPDAYKEFLLIAGKGFGSIFSGSDYKYNLLLDLQIEGKEIYNRRTFLEFPHEGYIFLIHQNYSFYFFNTNEGTDPPVYTFIEPDEPAKIELNYNTFSDFLFHSMDHYVKLNHYINKVTMQVTKPNDRPILER